MIRKVNENNSRTKHGMNLVCNRLTHLAINRMKNTYVNISSKVMGISGCILTLRKVNIGSIFSWLYFSTKRNLGNLRRYKGIKVCTKNSRRLKHINSMRGSSMIYYQKGITSINDTSPSESTISSQILGYHFTIASHFKPHTTLLV